MQHHNPFEKKGTKVNMNRFMSAVKVGKEQESCWTFTLFGYLITCLDQGYFKGGKFQRHSWASCQAPAPPCFCTSLGAFMFLCMCNGLAL